MRVAVLGAGAIGAYVGAALHRGGTEVHLIARGEHLAVMRRAGVTVLSPRGDFHAHPHATDDPREVGPVDIVFLGLKAYSYAAAGPLLAPLLRPGTGVVAAQNGIPWWYFHGLPGPHEGERVEAADPGGAVSAVIPPDRAIGCVVYSSAEIEAPGVIRRGGMSAEVAARAEDGDAVTPHGRQVLAPGEQVNVRAAAVKGRADVRADRPGPDNRHPHASVLTRPPARPGCGAGPCP